MCGRFAQNLTDQELVELTKISKISYYMKPRFNVAPGQGVPIIRKTNQNIEIVELNWGLLPSWAKEGSELRPQINARSETAKEKPMFRNAFKNKHCIIPISGFYEWCAAKSPYYIHSKDGKPLFLAGLWDSSYRGDGFTILTCEPNLVMKNIHNRMPVILSPENSLNWLNNSEDKSYIMPAKDDLLEVYQVSKLVNSPKNDSVDCIKINS